MISKAPLKKRNELNWVEHLFIKWKLSVQITCFFNCLLIICAYKGKNNNFNTYENICIYNT